MFSKNLLFLLTVFFSLVGAERLVPWTSLKDIHATLQAPQPTLATHFSFGTVTFKRQSKPVQGRSVYRGYDAAGTLRSIVISGNTSASASFLPDDGSVTLTATLKSFKIDSPHNHTSGHRCAHQDPTTPLDELVRRLHPQNTPSEIKIGPNAKQGDHYYIDAFAITVPLLRNFRIVFSTSKTYLQDKGWDTEMFEEQCILATEVVNTWFERDLGIHLVYITYLVAPTNLMTSLGASSNIQEFYNANIHRYAYDIGLFIEDKHHNFDGLCQPGAYTQESKAKCYSVIDHKTIAHELGHFFGALHTFGDTNSFEIQSGYTIMSYGYKDAFALGTAIQIASSIYWKFGVQPLDKIPNSNNRPRIVTKGLKKKYTIPPLTPFRFTIDANDPDEGDQLLFYAQQLNFKYGYLTPGKDLPSGFIPGEYILKGKAALLPTKEVTVNRTFYFQDYYDGFLMSRIFDSHEFGDYDKRYDIFLQVADKNDAKKVAYYTEYDEIIRSTTRELIKNNNSDAFNKSMTDKVSAIKIAPWLPQRDYFYTQVLVEPTYEPFVLNIEPNKILYTAGEVVTLSWTYDERVIPNSDHVTIRLSTDMKKSFPYTVASRVPVNSRTITVKIPRVVCVNTTERFKYNTIPGTNFYRSTTIPQGFFSIEHDEGIVFATTYITSALAERLTERANKGGFNISLPEEATKPRQLELQPVGTYVVDKRNIQDVLTSFFVYDKNNEINVTSGVSYVLVNGSTGEIIRQFSSLADSEAVLSTLKQNAGKYMKFAAIVGSTSTTGRTMAARNTGDNIFTMQLDGYSNAEANFITNFIDMKAFSDSAIEEGKSEEEKQEEEEEDTEEQDDASDDSTSKPNDDGNNSSPNDDGNNNSPNDDGNNNSPNDDGNNSSLNDDGNNNSPNDDGNSSSPNDDGNNSLQNGCGTISVTWMMGVAVLLLLAH